MKKALITGINGFAGTYLSRELRQNGYHVFGIDVAGAAGEGVFFCDIMDTDATAGVMREVAPDVVFHLAGQASVGRSWAEPVLTMETNIVPAVNLLDAAAGLGKECRLLVIGSSDQYGVVKPEECPIPETRPNAPVTPYAVSKQAQENLLRCLAISQKADVVFTRSFNHTGPGQKQGFVVPDLACRVLAAKESDGIVKAGNLKARRDFSDVRDSVRAYRLLAEKGRAGEVYNVGSGNAHSVEWILQMLMELAGVTLPVEMDAANLRPVDVPLLAADITKLTADTGYQPEIPIEHTLRDILDYFAKERDCGK